ncbi:flavin-containing monooxygenase [Nocardia camponoti]|uniref:4-hydroxyacetophenone monooxygenase n=1 Tax=Nocardia camponoti TaxID=1616106 RepID=A0A917QUZ5_9NOCA|nr:NAD(P)/FAD-dependent oxidoreductase [Nocardia camponoti]GGK69091.1 4-hydroxyacetophenone monooxygenase [Nocardia camponoti]
MSAPTPRHRVVIVGAGFGGLTMGAELLDAGIHDFLILEEGPDVGGVWRENTYPGCSCDVPSHLYSFAFDSWRDRGLRYPAQATILDYMRSVTERAGLRDRLRVDTAIGDARYHDDDGTWTLTTTRGQLIHADAVVWAVGQLHRPQIPVIPGIAEFGGRAFHSARWDDTAELSGHVAIVGTGSSAAQMLPEIARTAATVTVYQRTPAWTLPKPSARFGPVTRSLLRVPGAHDLYRAALHHGADLALAPIMHRGWSARPAEWLARAHLRRQVPDRALREQLTPHYRIGEKRILLDSGFYPALTQPHVHLVTDPIERLTHDGIRTVDGTHRPADTVVWATGFRATAFLEGITVLGRGGIDLHTSWAQAGRPGAFLGLAVPGFPNMFLIAGPNSFTPSNSNPTVKAHQSRYIRTCLELGERLNSPVEVSAGAMARFGDWLDKQLAASVWPDGVPSWFKRTDGQITNPWPATVREFGRQLRRYHPDEAFVPADPVCAPDLPVRRAS